MHSLRRRKKAEDIGRMIFIKASSGLSEISPRIAESAFPDPHLIISCASSISPLPMKTPSSNSDYVLMIDDPSLAMSKGQSVSQ